MFFIDLFPRLALLTTTARSPYEEAPYRVSYDWQTWDLEAQKFIAKSSPPATAPLPRPSDRDTVQLHFGASADVRDVLRLYEQLTERRLIYDNSVVGPMQIMVKEHVSRPEAVKIIQAELLKNNFSLIPTETKNVWKVFRSDNDSRPKPQ
jgi:hypothetical protein